MSGSGDCDTAHFLELSLGKGQSEETGIGNRIGSTRRTSSQKSVDLSLISGLPHVRRELIAESYPLIDAHAS